MELTSWLFLVGGIVAVAVLFALLKATYKVVPPDKALVITGGKKPTVKIAGGGFVIPIIRRHAYFDMCLITVPASQDEIKTSTGLPILVDWTAQIRASRDPEKLFVAVSSFLERKHETIIKDVGLTLNGAVREVVSSMTAEEVHRDKEAFAEKVRKSVTDEMDGMGFELVSLNIQEVTDNHGYFDNMSAKDKETKRREAENIKAETAQAIREKKADAERIAQEAELKADLAVAEEQRKNALRKADIQKETDTAQADAAIAGELQATERKKDLAIKQGQVEVARQEQFNLAARKEMDVIMTRATAEKEKIEIEANAYSQKERINADARAAVLEKEAMAQANAAKLKAQGEAEAIKQMAIAAAQEIAQRGEAEANVARQKGLADAEAIKARMLAEAEGEEALAQARASNEAVNFKLQALEIEMRAKIEVATAAAKIMADVGSNARFVNFGGNGKGEDAGNVLFDTLSQVPQLLEKLNITNEAVTTDGKTIQQTLHDTIEALVSPLGVLNKEKTVVVKDGAGKALGTQSEPKAGDEKPAEMPAEGKAPEGPKMEAPKAEGQKAVEPKP